MKLRFYFTSGLIILFFQSLIAQVDFPPSLMINNQNDTIYGTGNVSKSQEYCLFKKIGSDDYIKYLPNEFKVFRVISGKYYIAKEIKESKEKSNWYFLEYLVEGEINLYVIQNSSRFFLEKKDGIFLELKDDIKTVQQIDGTEYFVQDKRYIGYLRAYMHDTPELYPKIDKMERLKQYDLVNLAIDYHNSVCEDYNCINYAKKIPKITYKIEFTSGIIGVTDINNEYNDPYGYQIGFLVHIWRPLKNEKLFVKTGILYSILPNHLDSFGYHKIKIPLSFQYVFGKGDFKPTVAFGWPKGLFALSSLEGGFLYSVAEKVELSMNASIDGILRIMTGSPSGHSLNIGLVYSLK